MYAGKVVEEAPVEELFGNPRHPYTQGLIRSIPRVDRAAEHKDAAGGDSRHGAEPARARRRAAASPPAAGSRMDVCRAGHAAAQARSAPGHSRAACVL